jgi:hypothetical protein
MTFRARPLPVSLGCHTVFDRRDGHRPPISGSPARFTTASLRSIAPTNPSGAMSA